MQVQVHYQGLDPSPWLDQFIGHRLEKIERFLGPSASVHINLKYENKTYSTSLAIHGLFRDYAFSADGENLYESFSLAIEKANRSLGEQKRKLKDKIHRRFSLGPDDFSYGKEA
jgi:ribosomal subunit interface protein